MTVRFLQCWAEMFGRLLSVRPGYDVLEWLQTTNKGQYAQQSIGAVVGPSQP